VQTAKLEVGRGGLRREPSTRRIVAGGPNAEDAEKMCRERVEKGWRMEERKREPQLENSSGELTNRSTLPKEVTLNIRAYWD
jgi:hypothetical protein